MKRLDYLPQNFSAEELSGAVEFDVPFLVNDDGTVELSGNFGPDEVIGNYSEDEEFFVSDGWIPWSHGYTGQYGYNGPVMHDSEVFSGRMVDDVLNEPGEYCISPVWYMIGDDYSQDEDGMEVEGWMIVKAV